MIRCLPRVLARESNGQSMARRFTSARIRRCRWTKSPQPPFAKGGLGGFPAEETDCATQLGALRLLRF